VRLEGLGQLKKSTSSGLEPVTFRLLAQCHNNSSSSNNNNNNNNSGIYIYIFIYLFMYMLRSTANGQLLSQHEYEITKAIRQTQEQRE
jgi:hypothetical protein